MVGASALVAILACVATKVVVAADRKDLSREAAERNGRCDDARAAGRHSWRDHAERSEELLVPVTTTGHPADVSGVDFVIEAADNSVPVKRSVVQECQREMLPDTVPGSNYSTLPHGALAEGVTRMNAFTGIRDVSPVDKVTLMKSPMSDMALAKVIDFAFQIRKNPRTLNEARGLVTSRVIRTFTHEAIAAVGKAVRPE